MDKKSIDSRTNQMILLLYGYYLTIKHKTIMNIIYLILAVFSYNIVQFCANTHSSNNNQVQQAEIPKCQTYSEPLTYLGNSIFNTCQCDTIAAIELLNNKADIISKELDYWLKRSKKGFNSKDFKLFESAIINHKDFSTSIEQNSCIGETKCNFFLDKTRQHISKTKEIMLNLYKK